MLKDYRNLADIGWIVCRKAKVQHVPCLLPMDFAMPRNGNGALCAILNSRLVTVSWANAKGIEVVASNSDSTYINTCVVTIAAPRENPIRALTSNMQCIVQSCTNGLPFALCLTKDCSANSRSVLHSRIKWSFMWSRRRRRKTSRERFSSLWDLAYHQHSSLWTQPSVERVQHTHGFYALFARSYAATHKPSSPPVRGETSCQCNIDSMLCFEPLNNQVIDEMCAILRRDICEMG
jgi:hypothetical protein